MISLFFPNFATFNPKNLNTLSQLSMIHFNKFLHRTWGTSQALLLAFSLCLGLTTASQAQVNLTAPGALYSQNFDGADLASTQWVQFDLNTDGATNCPQAGNGRWNLVGIPCQIQTPANVARGGTGKCLGYEFNGTNAANDWAFSPALQLAAGSQYKFIYYYRSAGATIPEKMKAMVTSNNTPANAIAGVPASAPVKDYPNVINPAYQKDSIMFTPAAAGTFYMAFKAESDADMFFLVVDDVSVQNMTVPVNDIAITSISTTATVASCASYTANNSFKIKFKNQGSASQSNFTINWTIVRSATPNVTVNSGTYTRTTALASNATDSTDVTGDLTTGGLYTVTATAVLTGDAIPSNDVSTLARFNPRANLTTQGQNFFQGFTGLTNPATVGWVPNPAPVQGNTSGWQIVNFTGTTPNQATFCQRSATAANNHWLFSNCFDLVAGQTYRISYARIKLNSSNPAVATSDEKLRLYVAATGTANEANLLAGTQLLPTGAPAGDETITNTAFATVTMDFTPTVTGTHYFGFRQTSDVLPAGFPTTALAGACVDNFNVLSVPNTDLGIRSVSPTFATLNACTGYSNNVPITVKVFNNGTQAINTQDFTFKYRVRNSANAIIQAEATVASGTTAINAGAEADLTATVNVDMSLNQFYQVEIYSGSVNDPNRLNDTIKVQYRNGSRDLTANNASYTENFDIANTVDLAWSFLDAANTANSGDIFYNTTAGLASSGTRFLAGLSGIEATNSWASTGCLKLKAGQVYAIDFKYRTTAFVEKFKVVILNAALPTTAGTAVPAGNIVSTIKDFPALTSAGVYANAGLTTFTVPADGNYFIAFNHYSGINPAATQQNPNPSFVLIDDVAITVPQPPAAPIALTATPSTTTKAITLSWTAPAGATGYRVARSTSAAGPFTDLVTNHTTTSYTDSDAALQLSPTVYYYEVKAFSLPALISAAATANATIVATAPNPATALTATASTTLKQIVLNWTASSNAVSYKVQRSLTTATGFADVPGATGITGTTYTDNQATLAFNTTYFYRVIAVNGFSLEANSNEASASIINVATAAPVLNTVTNAATGLRNTISWSAVVGAASYRIERSLTGTSGFAQVGTSTTTSYEDNPPAPNQLVLGTTYHYRVIAVNPFGTVSPPSNVRSTVVTSLERNTFSSSITVSPNPSRDGKFKVAMPEIQKTVTFTILNSTGKEVFVTKGENEQNFEIKATGLAKGMYFLLIDSAKGKATKKIIVE